MQCERERKCRQRNQIKYQFLESKYYFFSNKIQSKLIFNLLIIFIIFYFKLNYNKMLNNGKKKLIQ